MNNINIRLVKLSVVHLFTIKPVDWNQACRGVKPLHSIVERGQKPFPNLPITTVSFPGHVS